MKTCIKCEKVKNACAFTKKKDGSRQDICRACRNKQASPVCDQCGQPPTIRKTLEGPVGGLVRFRERRLCETCLNPEPDNGDKDRVIRETLRDRGGNLLY